mgnify:FL=1
MKIFDCTTFYNEKMMMDVRFNVLNHYVSKFIVVESTFSHSGKKKKLNFNIDDYPKFKDKIIYLVIDHEPIELIKKENLELDSVSKRLNSLKRIEQSYNYMTKGIKDASDDDLIMLSDNDEIPDLSKLNLDKIQNNFVIFEQLFFYYKFNLLYDRMSWYGTKACKKKKLKKFSTLRNIKNKKYPFWRLDTIFSDTKQKNVRIIKNGGWHFTNLKTPDELFEKLSNFGHHDEFEKLNITIESLKDKINKKEVFYDHFADKEIKDKWSDSYKLKKIDNSFLPKYLNDNHEKFNEWFDT